MASLIENMAPEYTTDGAKSGNYYMHNKLLYLCKKDCSGLFDESNFEQVYLSDLLRGTANSNLGGLEKFSLKKTIITTNGYTGNVQIDYTPTKKCNYIMIFHSSNAQYQDWDSFTNCGTMIMSYKNEFATSGNYTDAVFVGTSSKISASAIATNGGSSHKGLVFILTDE